jgi:hypothetical protein
VWLSINRLTRPESSGSLLSSLSFIYTSTLRKHIPRRTFITEIQNESLALKSRQSITEWTTLDNKWHLGRGRTC